MSRLADFVLSHRALVVVVWLFVSVAGAATAPRTVESLSYDFGLPGQPAYETNQEIAALYGGGGVDDPLVLTVTDPQGTFKTTAGQEKFSSLSQEIAQSVTGTRVVTPSNSDTPALVSADGTQAVALLYPEAANDPYGALGVLTAAAGQADFGGAPVEVTNTILLSEGGFASERSIFYEIGLGGAGALVVLVLVFASLLAGLPLLVAAVSTLGTFLALLALTSITDVSFVVQYLVALIGLGVAIDYSLLIVMRWREERAQGLNNDQAVRTAMATAGRSVLFSGVTVAVSLAALIAVPLPFLRSIGLGGLLIPLLSVATSLTLVPVILHTVGPRLLWPHRQAADPTSPGWAAVARRVVARPWWVIAATTLLLLAMTAPLLGLRLGTPTVDTYGPGSDPGAAANSIVDSGLTPSLLRPTQVLVPADEAMKAAERLDAIDGVASASRVDDPAWSAAGTQVLQVYFDADPATESGAATLDRVREVAPTVNARVGGSPAEDQDFVAAVYGNAPYVAVVIVIVTFLLLARALRSVWLPIKALLLNVLSIGAAYGLTVLIWQRGIGTETLFGVGATGALTIWVPVAVFAFLFGLSMDYEVFILSRMREAYDEHGDNSRAVVEGIARTGRLVTSAALILFLAFIALSTVPVIDVKILATALALGIAIDAIIVRALLAPALVAVLRRANWTMPDALAHLLRINNDEPVRTPERDETETHH